MLFHATHRHTHETCSAHKPENQALFAKAIASGEELGRVATLRDITVLRDLETSKTGFVNRVSHDLRRPLTLIRGYAKMLPIVGPLNERQQQFVSNIANSVEETGQLVRGLLGLRAVETEVGIERRPLHLATVVADVVGAAHAVAEDRGVFLRIGALDPSAFPSIAGRQSSR